MSSVSAAKFREWRESPPKFVREVFGAEPDPWQDKVLEDFGARDPSGKILYNRIAMKACKNPGKTGVLAWLGLNFLLTRPHPKVICTSMTGENLADGLWTEFAKWIRRSEIFSKAFVWGKTSIVAKDHAATWWAVARTWNRSASQEEQGRTLAGKHEDYLLYLIDEAGGIPRPVVASAIAALGSGIETRIAMAGNPWDLEAPLGDACTVERHLWRLHEITGDPDREDRAPRVSIEWARQQIERYGRDDAMVMADVLGEFPPASINALLGPDEVSAAMRRHITEDQYQYSQKRLGVDVARFGDDRTTLFPRRGLVAFQCEEMAGARSHEIAARVAKAKRDWGSEMELIDATGGYGSGVADSLIQAGHTPIEVQFSGKPSDPRYYNKRSEMWFLMAEWVRRGGCLPNDPQLSRELTAPRYTFKNGKLLLEEKERVKERLGFSPDRADALALTFAFPELPGQVSGLPGVPASLLGLPSNEPVQMDLTYDPYARRKRG